MKEEPGPTPGTKVASADQIDELRQVTAGHALHIKVTVEFGEAGKVEQEVIDRVNGILGKVKTGWQIN